MITPIKILARTSFYFLIFSIFFMIGFLPIARAQEPASNNTGITYECKTTVNGQVVYGNCTFDDVMKAIKKVIDFAVEFALAFSVVILALAGFKYMTSGGSPGARAEANKMIWKVVKGIAFVLMAWLIVNLIMTTLVNTGQGGVPNFISN